MACSSSSLYMHSGCFQRQRMAINSCWSQLINISNSHEQYQVWKQTLRITSPSCTTIGSYHMRYPPNYWRKIAHSLNPYEAALGWSTSQLKPTTRRLGSQNDIIGLRSRYCSISKLSTSGTGIFSCSCLCTHTVHMSNTRPGRYLSTWYDL